MDYVKIEGLQNTFCVLRGPATFSTSEIRQYCKDSSSDGLLVVTQVDDSNIKMEYWNADGSRAEMCGNGIRCVARFAVDNKLVNKVTFDINTDVGTLKASWDGVDPNLIEVQVGKAIVEKKKVIIEAREYTKVNVGNPHAVTVVEELEDLDVTRIGPVVENSAEFPNKANVEFVKQISTNEITMRVWERGVGETKACGTGMVASCAAFFTEGLVELPATVNVLGGSAKVWLDNTGYYRMSGPAHYVE